jgi:hypothetical protein
MNTFFSINVSQILGGTSSPLNCSTCLPEIKIDPGVLYFSLLNQATLLLKASDLSQNEETQSSVIKCVESF